MPEAAEGISLLTHDHGRHRLTCSRIRIELAEAQGRDVEGEPLRGEMVRLEIVLLEAAIATEEMDRLVFDKKPLAVLGFANSLDDEGGKAGRVVLRREALDEARAPSGVHSRNAADGEERAIGRRHQMVKESRKEEVSDVLPLAVLTAIAVDGAIAAGSIDGIAGGLDGYAKGMTRKIGPRRELSGFGIKDIDAARDFALFVDAADDVELPAERSNADGPPGKRRLDRLPFGL